MARTRSTWRSAGSAEAGRQARSASVSAEDARLVRGLAVLSAMSDTALTRLLAASTPIEVAAGERIVRQGEPSDAAIIVLAGDVAIVNESQHGATLLARLSGPLLLGEIGALAEMPRTATARAETRVRALRIGRAALLEACRSAPTILLSVVGRLGQQLQSVNRAIGLYADGLSALERTEFDPAILEELSNPIAELRDFAEAFHRLAARIRHERRQRTEMASAALIQRSMLPQSLNGIDPRGRCDVFGDMRPAREVGGDFYDVFALDADRVALVIGDVCGKGVPASLFTAFTMTVFRTVARELGPGGAGEVGAIILRANRLLLEQNAASMFATVFFGVLDLASWRLDYTNCGHCPGLVRRRDGTVAELAKGGTPLGLFAERKTLTHSLVLSPGDALRLVTDGVTESVDRGAAEFGSERLLALLQARGDEGAAALVSAVMDSVAAFSAGLDPADDITCLAVRVCG